MEKKGNYWLCHMLRRNCLLGNVTGREIREKKMSTVIDDLMEEVLFEGIVRGMKQSKMEAHVPFRLDVSAHERTTNCRLFKSSNCSDT